MEDARSRRAEGWQSSRDQALTKIKDKIRQSCQAKATAQRHALLQRHRLSQGESHQLEVAVHAQLLQLVHDEVAASSRSVAAALSEFPLASTSYRSGGPSSPPSSPSLAAAAVAAAAAGAAPTQAPFTPRSPYAFGSSGRQRPVNSSGRDDFDDRWPDESYEAEVHDALRELEEQLLGSLMAEELDLLEQQQAAAMQEAAMQYEDMQGRSSSAPEAVLCPLCSRAYLAQQHGIIACPHERWQLDVRQEALTLTDMRDRLAHVYELHGVSGCSNRLQFRLEQLPGRCSWLAASCAVCQLLHVVI